MKKLYVCIIKLIGKKVNCWEIIRVGVDIKIKCSNCDYVVMMGCYDFDWKMNKIIDWNFLVRGLVSFFFLCYNIRDWNENGEWENMVLIVGIVGLLNVGKLILFNVIIKVGVEAVNYLFVMIDLNVGMVEVLDECL